MLAAACSTMAAMSLGTFLASADPAKTALVWTEDSLTYGELDRRSTELACALLDEGLQPGDRVCVHWWNAVEPVLLYFACFKAGLIVVPVNLRLKASEAAHIFRHSGAKVCFSEPSLAAIAVAGAAESGTGIEVRAKLPQGAPVRELPEPAESVIGAILYTSGTTALPKGVTHTHASLAKTADFTIEMGYGSGVMLATTQMTHISGFGCLVLGAMRAETTLVLMPKFDPAMTLDLIERHKVAALLALPAQLLMIVEEQSQRPRVVESVKIGLAGGDSVPAALQLRFTELFGAPLMEVLAMTESCPMIWNTSANNRMGSVGKASAGVEIKIVTREGLAADTGELCVRSPASFACYWNNPEATAAVLEDGWVHTGDLVRLDADGYVWFAGRLKQIIVRESVCISPQEVEDALYKHSGVLEAGVIGLPDPKYGEKVIAFVALRDGHAATESELRSLAAEHLADYKVPEKVRFLPVLPKGLTGKIDRKALSESFAQA